jgi:hypothetical protein
MIKEHKIKLFIIAIFCVIFFFPSIFLGGNKLLTSTEVKLLIEQQTGIVVQHKVLIFDTVLEDRGNLIKREIIKTKNKYDIKYLDYIFDCDDIALFITAYTKLAIAKKCGDGGAIILGTAFISSEDEYHALNLFIANGVVYLYDYQENLFTTAKHLSKDIEFILILL